MVDTLLFQEIRSLKTLKPSPETNEAFSKLVTFCLNADEKDITLRPHEVEKLQNLSSLAESEMETYWAKRIIASKNPNEELLQFWYYANYATLTDLEYANISLISKDMSNVLFVGSGPLPLTSILLCQKYGLKCTLLEKDQLSVELSRQLIQALKLDRKISIEPMDAMEYQNYHEFDLISVAALVGATPPIKEEIIETIRTTMKKNSLLLCRHSHGAKKLLYPSINKEAIEKLQPVVEVIPSHSIINSFFILQKT